jgi:photosystem II stability/assembly factor-like uncharacterized protein
MDAPNQLSRRRRRALPLVAGALAAMVIASLIYLNAGFPSLLQGPAAPLSPGPSLVQTQFSSMYSFVSATTGWALIVGPQSQPSPSYVYRTTDGAKHWNLLLTTYPACHPALAGIKFFDSKRGLVWIGTGGLYRTSDAGTHWDPVPLPLYPLNQITFSDPSHGWFLASEPDRGPRHFFATADGGDTWTELAWPLAGTGVGGLQFRRPGEGWGGTGASEPTVYSTLDGGATWQPHALPHDPQASPGPPPGSNFTFKTWVSLLPGVGVMAYTRNSADEGAYTSFDGGTTWRAVAPPPGNATYSDFVFQDSTHWWAMHLGDLWKSSDAGQSWKMVSRQLDGWGYNPQVIDAKHAWAELLAYPGVRDPDQGTGLAMTSDGGLHWTQVDTPRPT